MISPAVTKIYPTADSLPENLLRMYVLFSEPMKAVGNLEKIKLVDEGDQEVKGAIFNNVHELWNTDQKQLTLIFDPARVKTGLKVNESLGRALRKGQSYRLIIDGLESIDHKKMSEPFVKDFYVIAVDTLAPDMDEWRIFIPEVNTKEPLEVVFPDMIDQLSLLQRIVVVNDKNDPIGGTIDLAENEKKWRYTPAFPWQEGTYKICANARLADPSGNNLNGLFDHTIGSLKYEREGEILKTPFSILHNR